MAHEIEVKLRVADLVAVRDALRRVGARALGTVLERNTLFDTPDRRLFREDRGLRVRSCEPLDEYPAPPDTLTSKGPRVSTPGDGSAAGSPHCADAKTREEFEVAVDRGACAARILEQVGFRASVIFEKRREGWSCDDCLVTLDQLPRLGCFVEIEGPSTERIARVRSALGLSSAEAVAATYVRLVAELVPKDRDGCHVLRFTS